MPISSYMKKVLRNYRDYGIAITVKKVAAAAVSMIYKDRTYRIYRVHLKDIEEGFFQNGKLELRLVEAGESDLIEQMESMEEWLAGSMAERIHCGSICLAALDGNVVAGFNLISFGEVYMSLVNFRRMFHANESWSEQIMVSQDYRGQGLATSLRRTVFKILRSRGYMRLYGGTLPSNTANLKLSRKVGFQEIADIHYRKFLGQESRTFTRLRSIDD